MVLKMNGKVMPSIFLSASALLIGSGAQVASANVFAAQSPTVGAGSTRIVMKTEVMPQGDVSCLKGQDGGTICDDKTKSCYKARVTEDIADAQSIISKLTPAQLNRQPTVADLQAMTAGAPTQKRLELLGNPPSNLADLWATMSQFKVRCDGTPAGYSMNGGGNSTAAQATANSVESTQRQPASIVSAAPSGTQTVATACGGALASSCGVQSPSVFASTGNDLHRVLSPYSPAAGAR